MNFRLQSLLNVKHCVEESSFKPVFFYLCKSIFTFLKYANIKTFIQPSVENASIIHIIEHIFTTQDFILNFIFYLKLKIIFPSPHWKCGIILLSVLIKCSFNHIFTDPLTDPSTHTEGMSILWKPVGFLPFL